MGKENIVLCSSQIAFFSFFSSLVKYIVNENPVCVCSQSLFLLSVEPSNACRRAEAPVHALRSDVKEDAVLVPF